MLKRCWENNIHSESKEEKRLKPTLWHGEMPLCHAEASICWDPEPQRRRVALRAGCCPVAVDGSAPEQTKAKTNLGLAGFGPKEV